MGPDTATTTDLDAEITCLHCGYDLRGSVSDRCPECGHAFDRAALAESQIPWVHRREIGRFRAYWKTVWMVIFHPRRFHAEINRPVRYRDSQWFRWVTVLHVWALCSLDIVVTNVTRSDDSIETLGRHTIGGEALFTSACLLGLGLFLAAATGLPSYFFHPRRASLTRQNRAVAMSYYTSSALLLVWLSMPVAEMIDVVTRFGRTASVIGVWSIATGIPVLVWWQSLLRLARRCVPAGPVRIVAMGLALPVLWCVMLIACVGGVTWLALYVLIVVTSLS